MRDHLNFEVIGETRDDAVGEAYDKVARTINLPYPGGPHVDRLAAEGQDTLNFPRPVLEGYDFSFSGLKSAVINTLHNKAQKGETVPPEDVAASFQASVIDVLTEKTFQALEEYHIDELIVCGGVAANRGLRSRLEEMANHRNVHLHIPPLQLCTDNAAMIGAAAYYYAVNNIRAELNLNGKSTLDL